MPFKFDSVVLELKFLSLILELAIKGETIPKSKWIYYFQSLMNLSLLIAINQFEYLALFRFFIEAFSLELLSLSSEFHPFQLEFMPLEHYFVLRLVIHFVYD